MTAKAAELQREVKENAEDYQNYLKDLYGWENEIKAKDEILKNAPKTPVDDQVLLYIGPLPSCTSVYCK